MPNPDGFDWIFNRPVRFGCSSTSGSRRGMSDEDFTQPPRQPDPVIDNLKPANYGRSEPPSEGDRARDDGYERISEDRLAALEEAIEDRAQELIDRGYSEDFAWITAQDELCPQREEM